MIDEMPKLPRFDKVNEGFIRKLEELYIPPGPETAFQASFRRVGSYFLPFLRIDTFHCVHLNSIELLTRGRRGTFLFNPAQGRKEKIWVRRGLDGRTPGWDRGITYKIFIQ